MSIPAMTEPRSNPGGDLPNVTPGTRRALSKNASHLGPADSGSLAFVMPLIHPDSAKVSDYGTVEQVLKYTVGSNMAQTGKNTFSVVVCDRAPEWASRLPEDWKGRVFFLTLDGHPAFAANRNETRIDKGMKTFIGGVFAMVKLGAGWIMPMDADDFVHKDLAATVFRKGQSLQGDGFIFRNGVHTRLIPHEGGAMIYSATMVRQFDATCGSCRVFRARPFASILEHQGADFFQYANLLPDPTGQEIIPVPADFATALDATVAANPDSKNSTIHLLGRHVRQKPFFDLTPITDLLTAKGCGHGNHAGRTSLKGEIHWHRSFGSMAPAQFITQFGLCETEVVPASMLDSSRLSDLFSSFWGRQRRFFTRVLRKLGLAR